MDPESIAKCEFEALPNSKDKGKGVRPLYVT